ncbi:multidrug effflux MFS transporter [Segetibacter aerophilus]|uniref:multidrug effflux MFS transporter n=1 Tax=Segetibacter aerophilus TaxID=670293 RepID=UPI0011BECBE1|nr:multidrug effflux MFS transporter [Segetibacter aerophilus]
MKGREKFKLILILGLLSAIGPFSIDMYLPGFPSIAADLHTTVAKISLSLSSFFIGISFGQMLYGPLLDRYGRKRPLYLGLTAYFIASVGCTIATSADQLIWLRLLQALGSCSGMVASRAMVRDLFPVNENAKVFSLLMLVVGVSPIIAPTLGGYLSSEFSWHYVFAVLSVMSALILLAVHFYLPESRKPDPNFSLKPKPIINGFLSVAKEPQFYTYALAGSIASAGLYAYISGSPSVFMELYKVTEKQYGWIFAMVAIGLITSSQLNTVMLRKYKSEQIVVIALLCQSVIGALLVTGTIFEYLGLYMTVVLCFLFLSCQGFTFPNTSALSLAPFSKTAGSASALLGSVQMGIGAFTSALVSYLTNGTAIPMTGVMACCALTAFMILVVGGRIIRSKMSVEQAQQESAEMLVTS